MWAPADAQQSTMWAFDGFEDEEEEDLFAALPAALREALELGGAPIERHEMDKSSEEDKSSTDEAPPPKPKTRRGRRSEQRWGAPPRAAVDLNRKYAACTNAEEVLRIYAEKGVRNDVNVATAFTRLSRGAGGDSRGRGMRDACRRVRLDPRFKGLLEEAMGSFPEYGPQALANCAHSLARLGCGGDAQERRAWRCLVESAEGSATKFSAREGVNVAWACATARTGSSTLFDLLAIECEKKAPRLNAQELSIAAWAFATAGRATERLFRVLAAEAAPRVGTFNEQNLSNTAYAYVLAGVRAPELFDAVAREASIRAEELSAQALANLAWAFATTRHPAPQLYHALADQAERRVQALGAQNLASLAWAFCAARRARSHPRLYHAIGTEVCARLQNPGARRHFAPQAVATLFLACSAAPGVPYELFDALSQHALRRLDEFIVQDLANCAGALNAVGRDTAARSLLWSSIAAEAARRGGRLGGLGSAALLSVYCRSQPFERELFLAVSRESSTQICAVAPRHLATIVWCHAKASRYDPPLFTAALQEFARTAVLVPADAACRACWAFAKVAPVEQAAQLVDVLAPRLLAGVGAAIRNQQQQYSCRPQDLACLAETLAVVGFTSQRLGLTHALDAALTLTTQWADDDLRRLGLARAAAHARGAMDFARGCTEPAPSTNFGLSVCVAPGLVVDVGDVTQKVGYDCSRADDVVYDTATHTLLRDAGPLQVRHRLLLDLGWRVTRLAPLDLAKLVQPPQPPTVTVTPPLQQRATLQHRVSGPSLATLLAPNSNAAGLLYKEFNPAAATGLPPSRESNPSGTFAAASPPPPPAGALLDPAVPLAPPNCA